MRLYYQALILRLIYEDPKRIRYAASFESAVYRDPHLSDPGPVRILTERQFYEYLLELIKGELIISLALQGKVIELTSTWAVLRRSCPCNKVATTQGLPAAARC